MPVDWSLYPPNWKLFRAQILERAQGQCECTGECGLHQPNPESRRCLERQRCWAIWARGKVRLTIAHLCSCQPICSNPAHVKAMCQRCHLRTDRFRHAASRIAHQRAAKAPSKCDPAPPKG
jgi:hypothetical protein